MLLFVSSSIEQTPFRGETAIQPDSIAKSIERMDARMQ